MQTDNPCLTCGACCACFRASFYWAETEDAPGGTVPAGMTEKLNDFRVYMKGTNGPRPRCMALMGIVGTKVHCSIYENRPSVCRDFQFSWAHGKKNERCDAARAVWGMPPLQPMPQNDDPTLPILPKAA